MSETKEEQPAQAEQPVQNGNRRMTVTEVAAYVGKTRTTIYYWIANGLLRASQPAGTHGSISVLQSDVDKMMEPRIIHRHHASREKARGTAA